MPWNMQDYPNSMKNMPHLERKKAIDMANAMVADGYPEDRAIPIAMSQAEKWYENATDKEIRELRREGNPGKHDQHDSDPEHSRLIDADEIVQHQEDGWAVMAKGAKQASHIFDTKKEAVKRAREIADNKDSSVRVYRKNGTLQEVVTP